MNTLFALKMNTPETTPLVIDAKTEKHVLSLRKSLEQVVTFSLIGCIIPILWPKASCGSSRPQGLERRTPAAPPKINAGRRRGIRYGPGLSPPGGTAPLAAVAEW
ncbi:MAG: hypothetical protein K9M97_00275 [Akkermansiaceae bacterium]|nr:hypothetical protein [Akkermansiaceae bacterium]